MWDWLYDEQRIRFSIKGIVPPENFSLEGTLVW
jgi:hypothetical protein